MLAVHEKIIDHAQQFVMGALKIASQRLIQKIVKATGNLISHKIANEITKNSPLSNLY